MAADPKVVKSMLDDIEAARKNGRMVEPPSRLSAGNILGSRTDAFNEAVKQQGKMLNPLPKDGTWSPAEEEEQRRKRIMSGITGGRH